MSGDDQIKLEKEGEEDEELPESENGCQLSEDDGTAPSTK